MQEIFKTFKELLGPENPNGHMIFSDGKELKIKSLSIWSNVTDTITFVDVSDKYNEKSDWDLRLVQELLKDIESENIPVLAKYASDDPYISQNEYDRKNDIVVAGFKVSRQVRDSFRKKCEENNVSQASVIEKFMSDYK